MSKQILIVLGLSLMLGCFSPDDSSDDGGGSGGGSGDSSGSGSDTGKKLYLKNNGTTVGIILSFNENPINKPPYSERDYDFFVTSKNYFHFELFGTFRTPELHGQALYTSSNCLGNGYVKESLKRSVNTIFTGTGRKTYYLNSDASATSINIRSMSEFSGSCSSSSGSQTAYLLQENDESITGFPNTIGTLSIAYE